MFVYVCVYVCVCVRTFSRAREREKKKKNGGKKEACIEERTLSLHFLTYCFPSPLLPLVHLLRKYERKKKKYANANMISPFALSARTLF